MSEFGRNPLLMEEIVHEVFKRLDSTNDLLACHGVCQLWKRIVPPYLVTLRPPVLIQGEANDSKTEAYLASIESDPNPMLKSTKFKLTNAALSSPGVNSILELHRETIRELELHYARSPEDAERLAQDWGSDYNLTTGTITIQELGDLLGNRTPFLETLIFDYLPAAIYRGNLFPDHGNLLSSGHQLSVRRIVFHLSFLPTWGDPQENGLTEEFLVGLLAMCPNLVEIAMQGPSGAPAWNQQTILKALAKTDRLKQLRAFEIGILDDVSLQFLNSHVPEAQLRILKVKRMTTVSFRDWWQFLVRQSTSLECVHLPSDGNRDEDSAALPPMPRLRDLKYRTPYDYGNPDAGGHAIGPNFTPFYHPQFFPRLKVMRLKSLPMLTRLDVGQSPADEHKPCSIFSVTSLLSIPSGVDQHIMSRIGLLLPGLAIIRIGVPCGFENLLVSIWEYCPNVTDLFLEIHQDTQWLKYSHEAKPDTGPPLGAEGGRRSLNSIFAGIPDSELAPMDAHIESTARRTEFPCRQFPSILDLKKLRRLCIDGPEDESSYYQARRDKISDVCGYSTFAALSPEVTLVQLGRRTVRLSDECTQHICERTGLVLAPKLPPRSECAIVRLIRSGFGYETLGFLLPASWPDKKPRRLKYATEEEIMKDRLARLGRVTD